MFQKFSITAELKGKITFNTALGLAWHRHYPIVDLAAKIIYKLQYAHAQMTMKRRKYNSQ